MAGKNASTTPGPAASLHRVKHPADIRRALIEADWFRKDEDVRFFSLSTSAGERAGVGCRSSLPPKGNANFAWESEVWIAEDPDHMIHFNGERFLGPYPDVMPESE